jgi:hypothetical protein
MAAVTFQDVVVAHVAFSDGLRFHELVHGGAEACGALCARVFGWRRV